jgi:hypothetical protein
MVERAAGAPWGLAFALWQAANAGIDFSDRNTWNKWLKVVPRFIGNPAKAWTAYQDQAIVSNNGARVVTFDPNDTEQMTELIMMGLGYQAQRTTGAWDRVRALREATMYWDGRRAILLRQLSAAVQSDDPEARQDVLSAIRTFNQNVPEEAKGKRITSEDARQSVQRRAKTRLQQELGLGTCRCVVPLAKNFNRLYPEVGIVSQTEVK